MCVQSTALCRRASSFPVDYATRYKSLSWRIRQRTKQQITTAYFRMDEGWRWEENILRYIPSECAGNALDGSNSQLLARSPSRARQQRRSGAFTSLSVRHRSFYCRSMTFGSSKTVSAHLGRCCALGRPASASWNTSCYVVYRQHKFETLASMSSRTLSSRVLPTRTSSIGSTWVGSV